MASLNTLRRFISPGGREVTLVQALLFAPVIFKQANAIGRGQPGLVDYGRAAFRTLPLFIVFGWLLSIMDDVVFPGGQRTRTLQMASGGLVLYYTLSSLTNGFQRQFSATDYIMSFWYGLFAAVAVGNIAPPILYATDAKRATDRLRDGNTARDALDRGRERVRRFRED
jgi:hypothetical protein